MRIEGSSAIVVGGASGLGEATAPVWEVMETTIREMTTKERLHRLVDELSEAEAERALALVQGNREDPVIAAFHDAPEDDEPFTVVDKAALEGADEDIAAGRIISHGEMVRRFG
jgi:hypothetical protein